MVELSKKNQIRFNALRRGLSLKSELLRGGVGVGALKILHLLLAFAISIVLARGLGPEGYGQYVFVMAVIAIIALPVGPALEHLITREVSIYHQDKKWNIFKGLLRRAHQWVLTASALIAFILLAIGFSQAEWALDDRWTLLIISLPILPLAGISAIQSSTLRGLLHVFYGQLAALLVRPSLHLISISIVILFGFLNPATAIISDILAATGGLLFAGWLLRKCRPNELRNVRPRYRQGQWFRTLLPFTLLAAVGTVNSQIGILVLGWFSTNADVAALQIAMNGAMLVALSLTIVNLVIAPHITRAYREGDKDQFKDLARKSARAALAVAFPLSLPLIFFGKPLVRLVYGDIYVDAVTPSLAILATAQLVNVAFGSVGMFLIMTNFERDTLYGQLIALIATIIAATVLVPFIGGNGAALAVALGILTWNFILTFRFIQRFGFRPTAF